MSNLQLGYSLTNSIPPNVCLILFTSRFCSKCMKTRQLLQDQSLLKYALEVDIGSHSHILFELAPRVVPTLILVSNDGTIVYVKEGLIHPEEAGKLFEVITQNFSSFIRE